jgi:hypothetical protein
MLWHGRDLRLYKRLLSPPMEMLGTCPGASCLCVHVVLLLQLLVVARGSSARSRVACTEHHQCVGRVSRGGRALSHSVSPLALMASTTVGVPHTVDTAAPAPRTTTPPPL